MHFFRIKPNWVFISKKALPSSYVETISYVIRTRNCIFIGGLTFTVFYGMCDPFFNLFITTHGCRQLSLPRQYKHENLLCFEFFSVAQTQRLALSLWASNSRAMRPAAGSAWKYLARVLLYIFSDICLL